MTGNSKFLYEFSVQRTRNNGLLVCESNDSMGKSLANPQAVAEAMSSLTEGKCREHFVVFFLNVKNKVIGYEIVHIGTSRYVAVDPQDVFRTAIMAGAASIMVSHNHPSGDPTPSVEDVEMTSRLQKAGEILGIPLIDHVVVGDDGYVSIRELSGFAAMLGR